MFKIRNVFIAYNEISQAQVVLKIVKHVRLHGSPVSQWLNFYTGFTGKNARKAHLEMQ